MYLVLANGLDPVDASVCGRCRDIALRALHRRRPDFSFTMAKSPKSRTSGGDAGGASASASSAEAATAASPRQEQEKESEEEEEGSARRWA